MKKHPRIGFRLMALAVIPALLGMVLLSSTPAQACRIIYPPRPWPPQPPPRPLPPPQQHPMEVRTHRAEIQIRHHRAQVTVDSEFRNPNPHRIEGIYVFPVPPGAAVSSFAMSVNGRSVEAELLDATAARKAYEDIVRREKDPALLEYLDQGLLRARVFPIEPHAAVSIHLTYESPVRHDGSLARISYPLLSARPGGNNRIGSLQISATVELEKGLKTIFVPGFSPHIQRQGDTRATLTFTAKDVRPERDFDILFGEDSGPVGIDVVTFRDGDQGYFMMLLAADNTIREHDIAEKHITFVIDTSGSMMGEKIAQAKEALRFCVQALNPADRFNIIAFATDVTPFRPAPIPADSPGKQAALEFIDSLNARGGTAIDSALKTALQPPPATDLVDMIVFLTDGLPTVGQTDATILLRHLERCAGRRIFTFGVGYDVNTRLLDGLAAGSRGSSSYVRTGENLEIALSDFYTRIAYPAISDLQLDSGPVRLYACNPPELPDLFKGSQVMLTGRYHGEGRRRMALSGILDGKRTRIEFEADLQGDPRHAFVPRLWAVSRVGYLQEQIRINGPNDELIDEIRQLGRTYGILTEYTSFLVVEEGIAPQHREQARAAFRRAEKAAEAKLSGAAAVERAARGNLMKQGADTTLAPPPGALADAFSNLGIRPEQVQETLKHADDKTFYLRHADNTWYDSLIPAGSAPAIDRTITLWSEDFFSLLQTYPALRRYVLAGAPLVVCLGDEIVRLNPAP